MNEINQKRIKKVLEELKQLEEDIVPCWAEEDHILSLLCDDERYSEDIAKKYDRIVALEQVLYFLRRSSELLRFVYETEDLISSDSTK